MLSYPNQGIRVPLQGIAGMDEPAARLSRVVEGAAQVAASLADVKDQVTSAGELADFVGRLQNIETDTRELLRGETVQDWAYAWNQTSEPMLREAIQELHPSSREAGKRLAELYNARACHKSPHQPTSLFHEISLPNQMLYAFLKTREVQAGQPVTE